MKKILAFLISALMLFATLPASVLAAENSSEIDQLMSEACSVFPEYAATIRGERIATYSRSKANTTNEMVVYEVKEISENRTMFYMELSDGSAYVSNVVRSSADYSENIELVDRYTGSGGATTIVTITIVRADNRNEYVIAENVMYTTVAQGNASINSTGDTSRSTADVRYVNSRNQSGTTPACLTITADYQTPYYSSPVDSTYKFYVSGTSVWATMDGDPI